MARIDSRTLGAAFCLAFLGLVPSAPAAEVTLKLHHFLPAGSVTHSKFLEPWARKLEAESNGRIEIQIFPAMQLGGKAPQLYDQVRDGVVDIVWTLPGYSGGRFPVVSVFELPFMVSSAEATSQAVQAFSERFLVEEFGDVKPLLFHVHGRGALHSRVGPIETAEDLKGLKVRGPNRLIGDALGKLGASPVFMPVPQVAESLAKGVIDGAVLPFEVAWALKVHELVAHHTQTAGDRGLYTAVFLLAMNKDRFQSLPADLRAVIEANSGLPLAKRIGRVWDEAEEPGRAAARERGNGIVVLDPAEVERWRDATAPVIDDWVARMSEQGHDGAGLLEAARGLIADYSE